VCRRVGIGELGQAVRETLLLCFFWFEQGVRIYWVECIASVSVLDEAGTVRKRAGYLEEPGKGESERREEFDVGM
jgi:hypothetical protein